MSTNISKPLNPMGMFSTSPIVCHEPNNQLPVRLWRKRQVNRVRMNEPDEREDKPTNVNALQPHADCRHTVATGVPHATGWSTCSTLSPNDRSVERDNMKSSAFALAHSAEDLIIMRKAISRLADRLGLDLSNPDHTRRCLDGDFSTVAAAGKSRECQELRDMLIVLLRLESSSSEDLGIDGLRRLWQKQRELMNRFYMREPLRIGRTATFQPA